METKNEIIERLIREGHLKLNEALVLLEREPMPQIFREYPYLPGNYPPQPLEPYYGDGFKVICNTANQEK